MKADARLAEKRDVRALAGVLGRAFYDDPVTMWMMPDNDRRARAMPRVFATLARHHFVPRRGSEVASRDRTVGGVALWDPPGQRKSPRLEELVMMPGLIWAMRSRSAAMNQMMELMEAHHPEEPHWYLMLLGSDPTVRGQGFGSALMRSRLDRCDAEGSPAYLENSNPKNEAFYMRFGFEARGEIKLPDGGPSLIPMWRDPR